jgi:hypothetical protein
MFNVFKISNRGKLKGYSLSDLFPYEMFWDVEIDNLSLEKDSRFIIQRVLSRSMNNSEYFEKLEKLYSNKRIKSIAIQSPEIIGNEDIEFIASRYHLNPERFKKYIPNIAMYA